MDQPRISLTPSVARQTSHADFGTVLQQTLKQAGQLTGAVLGSLPGAGIISAAVSQVTALAQGAGKLTAGGPAPVSQAVASGGGTATGAGDLGGYVDQMRQEADRSLAMQMEMQQESREYNALSNVLKVRHDSAKAAINNLR